MGQHTADDDCPLASPRKFAFCDTIWRFGPNGYQRSSERITTRVPAGIRP